MRRRTRIFLTLDVALVIAVLLLIGCAVQSAKAPQISSGTAWELNAAVQLQQVEGNYRTFFKDVGDAQRARALSASQVGTLNDIGRGLKVGIETANKLFKDYQITRDEPTRLKVATAITDALNIYLNLVTIKSQMLVGGKP